jgi:hypothetical protein
VRSLALGEGSAEQRVAHVRVHVVPVGGCAAIAATFMLGRIEGVTRQPGHARQPSASDRIANQPGCERTAASFPACTGKRFIKNPDSIHQDSNPTNVFTQPAP